MRTKSTLCQHAVGALVLLAMGCQDADVASLNDGDLPWLAVLAEEALAKWQQLEDVPDRPVVNTRFPSSGPVRLDYMFRISCSPWISRGPFDDPLPKSRSLAARLPPSRPGLARLSAGPG